MSQIQPQLSSLHTSAEDFSRSSLAAQQVLLPQYVTLRELCLFTTLGRSSVYEKLDQKSPRHDPTFPRPVKLGKSRIAFDLSQVKLWLAQRIEQSSPSRN